VKAHYNSERWGATHLVVVSRWPRSRPSVVAVVAAIARAPARPGRTSRHGPARYVEHPRAGALVGVGVAWRHGAIGVARPLPGRGFRGRCCFHCNAAAVMAYAYTDLLQFAGPRRAARDFGWSRRTTGSRRAPPGRGMFVFTLYPRGLLARTGFLSGRRPRRGGEDAWPRRRGVWRVEARAARSPAASRSR
jgi:hypothetical protein